VGGMASKASTLDDVLTIGLLLWAVGMWVAIAVAAYYNRGSGRAAQWVYQLITCVVVIGVIGQIGHAQEHFAQTGYWVLHPMKPAWMTPWGTALANGFGVVDPMKKTLGMEILHLVGNFIFLAGLVAALMLTKRATATKAHKWAVMGVWMQGIHGLEHLSLTVSVWLGAPRAIGMSTWFGLIPPGPALTTYRVWWHFGANFLGTVLFGVVLYYLVKEKEQIQAGYQTLANKKFAGELKPAASAG
jgi:hypothetical protein